MIPRVSVLLTTWNRPAMLQDAVMSVLRQTYREFELIVLDDNSDDPEQHRLLEYCDRHPKCRVWRSDVTASERGKKVRYAVLANVGLRLAAGEYITYLCDDDFYYKERLKRMVARLDRDGVQAVYGTQALLVDGQVTGYRAAVEVLEDAFCKVDHSSVMHTKAVANQVGGWDESPQNWRFADGVFWRKLNQAGHAFHPINEVLDAHRFHAGSVTSCIEATGAPV